MATQIKICPHCFQPNAMTSTDCASCFRVFPLDTPAEIRSVPDSDVPEYKFCLECGQPAPLDTLLCSRCKRPTDWDTQPPSLNEGQAVADPQRQEQKRAFNQATFWKILAVVGACLGALSQFNRLNERQAAQEQRREINREAQKIHMELEKKEAVYKDIDSIPSQPKRKLGKSKQEIQKQLTPFLLMGTCIVKLGDPASAKRNGHGDVRLLYHATDGDMEIDFHENMFGQLTLGSVP